MTICHFRAQNGSFVLNKKIFVQTITITFHFYLLALAIVQNSKKILTTDPELWLHIFWAQNGAFATNFFGKKLLSFHLPIGPFHCVKCLKNSSSRYRIMKFHHFWSQNGPFAQMRIFSKNMLIRLVPFIHAYLNAKNESKILIC